MAQNSEQMATEAVDKLMQAVERYGPKATELVLEAGRIAAMQTLVYGFACLLILLIVCGILAFCIRRIVNLPSHHDGGWGIGVIVCCFAATISLIGGIVNILNVFAWVGIQHPEIYLAAKLLKL